MIVTVVLVHYATPVFVLIYVSDSKIKLRGIQ